MSTLDQNTINVPSELPVAGMGAGQAARLAMKSQFPGYEDTTTVRSDVELDTLTNDVLTSLAEQGIEADATLVKSLAAQALKSQVGMVTKAVDPVVLPQPYVSPTDFAAQYPTPLDPTEILTLCEEISTWRALPEVVTDYNADQWREMNTLAFTGDGLTYEGFFAPGACPEEYTHDGTTKSITRRYLGVKKSLTNEEIRHSMAVARVPGLGISQISSQRDGITQVMSVKEKEIKLQEILLLNSWDRALVKGSRLTNTLAFDGIESQVTAANGARVNTNTTGAFDVESFDNFLVAGCIKPTHIFGHPKALEAIKKGYLSLGATGGSQPVMMVLQQKEGQVVPGMVLADMIDTSVGRLMLVPDYRFTATTVGDTTFSSSVFPLRVFHNGEPIVYKSTQTPLSYRDLVPGCTAISFEIYTVSALVVKHMVAQSRFQARFTGRIGSNSFVAA